jgi:hypothetical protein
MGGYVILIKQGDTHIDQKTEITNPELEQLSG